MPRAAGTWNSSRLGGPSTRSASLVLESTAWAAQGKAAPRASPAPPQPAEGLARSPQPGLTTQTSVVVPARSAPSLWARMHPPFSPYATHRPISRGPTTPTPPPSKVATSRSTPSWSSRTEQATSTAESAASTPPAPTKAAKAPPIPSRTPTSSPPSTSTSRRRSTRPGHTCPSRSGPSSRRTTSSSAAVHQCPRSRASSQRRKGLTSLP